MSIFKDCDVRGIYPTEIDEAAAHRIGRAVLLQKRHRVPFAEPCGSSVRVANSMMFSWFACSLSKNPAIRPSAMTAIRWLSRKTSGSSDEIMMIDLPSAASWLSSA